MEKRGVSSMESGSAVWDWEVLPEEHRSFYAETRPAPASHGGGGGGGEVPDLGDQESEERALDPSEDGGHRVGKLGDEYKDIGGVPAPESRLGEEEESSMAPPPPATVTELPPPVSDVDGEEEEKLFRSSGAKAVAPEEAAPPHELAGEEEEEEMMKKKKIDGTRAAAPCVVFSVGKLKVNGIGALCSFGVAAATVCVFLVGGKLQHQQKLQQQQEKLQLQFLGDDKRMQQVVQQTSRLNQAMSSVMGGSTRANISFGGFYDGF